VVKQHPGPFTHGKNDSVPIVQEVAWVLEPVWKVAENIASTAIRSRSNESQYRLG
jgi:hypothetical protein